VLVLFGDQRTVVGAQAGSMPAPASNMLALPFHRAIAASRDTHACDLGGARAFCPLWPACCRPAVITELTIFVRQAALLAL
jgi:hypothetical protein